MEQALREHRGGRVLALGILSLAITLASVCVTSQRLRSSLFCLSACVIAVPFGLLAIVFGWRQAAGMKAGRIDPAGRRKTRTGQVLGAVAIMLSVAISTCIITLYPSDEMALMSDGTCVVTEMHYGHVPEVQYHAVLGLNGELIKEGSYVRWNRSGMKLEEGSYHKGKRDGQWIFRNEDGSIDLARAGVYENDVRVQAGSTPPGDYPVREVPPGYGSPR